MNKKYREWFGTQLKEPEFLERVKNVVEAVPLHLWILLGVSVICLIYHWFFIKIVIKKAAPMDFFPESTPEENDDFAKGLGVAYFLPLIEWIVTKNILDVNESVSGCFLLLIGVFAVVISLIANKSYGSPLYMLAGYHFHTIQTENSKSYVLMSKKKHFRNRTQVYRVIRLFEDLLIDVT